MSYSSIQCLPTSEKSTGDWFWLGGNGVQVRGGREQKKLITGDL